MIDGKEELHTHMSLVTGVVICIQTPTQKHRDGQETVGGVDGGAQPRASIRIFMGRNG